MQLVSRSALATENRRLAFSCKEASYRETTATRRTIELDHAYMYHQLETSNRCIEASVRKTWALGMRIVWAAAAEEKGLAGNGDAVNSIDESLGTE